MAESFTLIDRDLGWQPVGGDLWDVVQVSYGHQTEWELRIELERGEQSAWVSFTDPVSFRVQDEREMLDLWAARASEGVDLGTFYAVGRSEYLAEISKGVSGLQATLTHYVVAGLNTCVEVVDRTPPRELLATQSFRSST